MPAASCDCNTASARRVSRRHLPLIPAALLLTVPKCPLCILMWSGLTGMISLPWAKALWGVPLDLLLLSPALLALAIHRNSAGVTVGLVGATVAITGRTLGSTPLLAAAIVLVAAALILPTRREIPKQSRSDEQQRRIDISPAGLDG